MTRLSPFFVRGTLLALVAVAGLLLFAPAGYGDNEDQQAEQAEKPPANPLGNWLRNMLNPGGKKPKVRISEDGAENGEDGTLGIRDVVDRSAPHDPEQAKQLARARSRIEKREWKEALELLQLLLDRPDDSMVRLSHGEWVSLQQEANRLLSEFPPEMLEHYRLQYGATARQALSDAYANHDPAAIAGVATRYFHTDAGPEASDRLGSYHVDRGEFGLAAHWFTKLLAVDAPATRNSAWRLKAAFAMHRAGRIDEAKQILSLLDNAPNAAGLDLGGSPIRLESWLKDSSAIALDSNRPLDEWRMLYGSPSRSASPQGGEPLLLPRWSQPLTLSQTIDEQATMLVEDLADQGRAAVPAWFPLMVDGKVIYRTLRGVQVVDAQTGEPLWETRDTVSAEELLSGDVPAMSSRVQQQQIMMFRGRGMRWHIDDDDDDHHPLTSLLFRNGAYGILSCDDRQLYVLENQALMVGTQPEYRWGGRVEQADPFRRDWSSNRIAAYDLDTGRPRWTIGGPEMHEAFDQQLAGHYFFATPVRHGTELYVVGEKDNEIRLFSLDPETGRPRWSQLIAVSPTKIEEDLGRRLWTSQIAVSDGVIICPTTVGWLVAVDRIRHSVLWAERYTQAERHHHEPYENSHVEIEELNSRWCPSAPIVAGNRVIYTPSEEGTVVCLDVYDGESLWKAPKSDFLYVAGTHDDSVILVGKTAVAAHDLEDGRRRWKLEIPPEAGLPSGVGVAVGGQYYLPLRSGQLWSIDMTAGTIASRSYLHDGQPPLGNLAMYRGMLLSLGPAGLTTFEQREAIEQQIEKLKEQNAADTWALLREADIHLLHRDYENALASLRQIDPDRLTNSSAESRYRKAMLDSLAAVIRSDFEQHAQEIDEFGDIAQSPDEMLLHRRLQAERHDDAGDYLAAFELYRQLGFDESNPRIGRQDGTQIEVGLDRWVGGKLIDLWSRAPEAIRAELDRHVEQLAGQYQESDIPKQQRFVTLFGFHPAAAGIQRTLIERHAAAGELAAAERLLLPTLDRPDAETTPATPDRPIDHPVAGLLKQMGLPADADYLARRITKPAADDNESSEADESADSEPAEQAPLAEASASSAWRDGNLRVVSVGGNGGSQQTQELAPDGRHMPFFQSYRFEIDAQHDRLAVIHRHDESLYWLAPLRRSSRNKQEGYSAASISGHLLFVLHGDILHALSPAERKVLWMTDVDTRGGSFGYYRTPEPGSALPMQPASTFAVGNTLETYAARSGMLAVANSQYVCLYGRREFRVYNATTGDVLWVHPAVAPNTSVYGTEDVLFVVSQSNSTVKALRALDGKPLDIPDAEKLLTHSARVRERGLLIFEEGQKVDNHQQSRIRLYDPLRDRDLWSLEVPSDARLSANAEGQLACLERSGRFSVIDLLTGTTNVVAEEVPEKLTQRFTDVYALFDSRHIYLTASRRSRRNDYEFGEIPSVPVNGLVVCFDRARHEQKWSKEVRGQHLVYEQFGQSPLLVFAKRKYVRKGIMHQGWIDLLAINKETGRQMVESSLPLNSLFHSLHVNTREHYIELSAYDQRLRLMPAPNETATAE